MSFRKKESNDASFRRLLRQRTGWAGEWIPLVALRRMRATAKENTPEERTETRLLRIANEKANDRHVALSMIPVTAMAFLGMFGFLEAGLPALAIKVGAPIISVGWFFASCVELYGLLKTAKQEVPVFLETAEDKTRMEEMRRVILAEERLAEKGFGHEEMKRMSAVMVASSVASEAGITVSLPDDVSALFERARTAGSRLLTTGRPEGDDLFMALRSVGVEAVHA